MRVPFWTSFCACLLLAGCYSTPPADPDAPEVRLNAFNGDGRPVYAAPRGTTDPDRCFTVRGFPQVPAHLGLTASNPAGIGRIEMTVLVVE